MKGNDFVSKQSKVEVMRMHCLLVYSLFCYLFSSLDCQYIALMNVFYHHFKLIPILN